MKVAFCILKEKNIMRTSSYTLRTLNGLNTLFGKGNGFVPLLFIYMTFLCIASVTGVCKNVGPNSDENLANTCDWSSWYSWNCSCCSVDNNQFQFRKRAICCDENESLPVCLSNCNYTEDSDTMFANCSQDCVPRDGEKCTQAAPGNITLMLPAPTPTSTDLTSTMTTEVNRQSTNVLYSSNATYISKSALASTTSVSGVSSTVPLSTTTNDTASSLKYLTTSSSNASIDSSNSSMSRKPPKVSSDVLSTESSVLPTNDTASPLDYLTTSSSNASNDFSYSSMSIGPPNVSSDVLSTESSVIPTADTTSSLSNSSTQVGTSVSVQVSVGVILGVVCGCLVFLAVLVSTIILLKRKKLKSAVEPDMNAEDAELTHRDYSENIANKEIPREIYHNQID